MDLKYDKWKKRPSSYTRRRSYTARGVKEEAPKKERFLVQAIVSAVMVVLVLGVTSLETPWAVSFEKRLETAVTKDVSAENIQAVGNFGKKQVSGIGKKVTDFLKGMGAKEEKNQTTQTKKENQTGTVYIENETSSSEAKNTNPPEVILPES